jgi:hypothetical protein
MKKGAMFGLDCRALKKQFGELFLASRQSEAPQGANGSCGYTKRGAMFGLDARIALAIFGALSVISGAALYSAIQESKVIQFLAQHDEYAKAIEAYLLDTGVDLQSGGAAGVSVHARSLITNYDSADGWKGPYLAAEESVSIYELKGIPIGSWKHLFIKKAREGVAWGDPDFAVNACNGSKDCFYWVETNCYEKSFVETLDAKIDGSVDADEGRFRYALCTNPNTMYKVYYQAFRTLKQ